METKVKLKDGQEVLIRDMRRDDVDRSFAFFASLPPDDRRYLRRDVTRRDIVEARVREMEGDRVLRLVAVSDDEIVADAALELRGHAWGENNAEIRLIVSRCFQRVGLGTCMAHELYVLASQHKVDRLVVRMMRPQKAAQSIFRQLGFHDEFLIPDHVLDATGRRQDLVIMRCNLDDLWCEMENLIAAQDSQHQGPPYLQPLV